MADDALAAARRAERLMRMRILHPEWTVWAGEDGWHGIRREPLLLAAPDDRIVHAPDFQDFARVLDREDGTGLALAGRCS